MSMSVRNMRWENRVGHVEKRNDVDNDDDDGADSWITCEESAMHSYQQKCPWQINRFYPAWFRAWACAGVY